MISINANASNNSHKKSGPPPEAFTACQGKEVGDAVTFSGHNGENVEAVCKEIQDQLVASPDKMPPKCSDKRHGPPPEAISACKGKEVGDAIAFSGRNGENIEAVCKEIQGQLVAAPDNMPPQ